MQAHPWPALGPGHAPHGGIPSTPYELLHSPQMMPAPKRLNARPFGYGVCALVGFSIMQPLVSSRHLKQKKEGKKATKTTSTFKVPNKLHKFACHDPGMNTAFMMLKPHANTGATRDFVFRHLEQAGINVRKHGEIDAEAIDAHGMIDNHYGSLADKALRQRPADLLVQPEAEATFREAFGLTWQEALEKGLVLNAGDAMRKLQCSEEELERLWAPLELGVGKVKLGGGCYVGKIGDFYVVNAFYMVMRAMYTKPGRSVHWFLVDWQSDKLSWKDFRRTVLGATHPADAEPTSLRGLFYQGWKGLGLAREPHVGENVMHASASPLEAFVECRNWLQIQAREDRFGKMLLERGVPATGLHEWTSDPLVQHGGRLISVFDLFEDRDTRECLDLAVELGKGSRADRKPAVGCGVFSSAGR
mmetsp:Transcript_52067/g.161567  ORF Transcript_52067/g.161567 Transcript_52067/m.161567 type:complete len:417 (+) Transcript_52067:80-1330(+)